MTGKDRLESVKEASERLAVSAFTIRRLISAGQVRAVRVGYRVLIPSTEIQRIIESGAGKHASAMHVEA
jgi:excisionase family DNA binding protein